MRVRIKNRGYSMNVNSVEDNENGIFYCGTIMKDGIAFNEVYSVDDCEIIEEEKPGVSGMSKIVGYMCTKCGRTLAKDEICECRNKSDGFNVDPFGYPIPDQQGVKYDTEKTRLELLPFEQIEQIAEVLTIGAKKYSDDNWKKVMPRSRYIGASLRHIFSWIRGEKLDKETGKSHLAHAVCCLLFLMWADDNDK